ncbi:3-phosphoshikimate 1-carboxyvinyltransferase [Thalassobacillus pellis]|nr:3-phosphoshikimate 1-carboxyvinyltransferase [Thalassobacillus pellis]
MKSMTLRPIDQGITGEITVPGDKSISHRSVIFASLASGTSTITNFLAGEDCLRTINVFRSLGVNIDQDGTKVSIKSDGVGRLKEAECPVYFGNSGTTARLVTGVLASLPLFTTCYGDPSLSNRPMDRVITPLSKMGANIQGRDNNRLLPIAISGKTLKGITYEMPVKSAQVKSAILLAGMLGEGETTVIEQVKTRDHTEQMLPRFGVGVEVEGLKITIKGGQRPHSADIAVPGDISSAAFFLVAAAVIPGSHITVKDVGLNETRTGIITALEKMGANIQTTVTRTIGSEPVGDIEVKYAPLKGSIMEGDLIPALIDELPILALAATQAEGKTIIKDAEELRVKETDRIAAVADVLTKLGADVTEQPDGLIIHGKSVLRSAEVDSYMDHRIGMMVAIASLLAEGNIQLTNSECIAISYPDFFKDLEYIIKK